MTELKQAYERLGLDTQAPREEVEARYDQLLRKERAKIKRGESTNDNPEFAKVTEAYRTILAYDLKSYTEQFEANEYSKYKGMADKAKKFDHFWSYYKWHTVAAIVILGIIVYSIMGIVEKQEQKRYEASLPPIDLRVSFLGHYIETESTDNMEITEARLLKDFPQLKRIESDIIFVPNDPTQQVAYLQKAFVMVGTENPDIYLLDEEMLQWGGNGDIFAPLDQYEQFAELIDTPYAKTHINAETNKEATVAIDLTGTSLAEELNVYYKTLYAAIRVNAPNFDHALEFIEKYAAEITTQP